MDKDNHMHMKKLLLSVILLISSYQNICGNAFNNYEINTYNNPNKIIIPLLLLGEVAGVGFLIVKLIVSEPEVEVKMTINSLLQQCYTTELLDKTYTSSEEFITDFNRMYCDEECPIVDTFNKLNKLHKSATYHIYRHTNSSSLVDLKTISTFKNRIAFALVSLKNHPHFNIEIDRQQRNTYQERFIKSTKKNCILDYAALFYTSVEINDSNQITT